MKMTTRIDIHCGRLAQSISSPPGMVRAVRHYEYAPRVKRLSVLDVPPRSAVE